MDYLATFRRLRAELADPSEPLDALELEPLKALDREAEVPFLHEKVIATGGYSVSIEVVEITRTDRPAPTLWERRVGASTARGGWWITTKPDRTSDPAVARLWVRALASVEKRA